MLKKSKSVFKRTFNPAIKLMNLFSYPVKFAIVAVLILILSVYTYYNFYSNIKSNIDLSASELKGDLFIKDLYEMLYISGKVGYADANTRTTLLEEFDKNYKDLEKVYNQHNEISSKEKINAINIAYDKAKSGGAGEAFDLSQCS